MSVIEKMSVIGIRSFGPDDKQKQIIEFFTPLTLILGPNGSGKTTIIECLRYMTTGDHPPNSDRGGSFIHDPKIAGETEVKGQVKLQFKDVLGKKIICTRSMIATQKQKRIQVKTLEGTITRYNANGEKSNLSSKCAELDNEMISSLGVSKAILNHVIFCHQEESNWPLSEGKALKQKFDEIFAATRYIKALDEIRKIRAAKMVDIREYKVSANSLKANREKAAEFAQELEKTRSRHAACKDAINTIENKVKPVTEELNSISIKETEIGKLQAELESNTKFISKLEKDQQDLSNSIKNVFVGAKEDLKEEMDNFNTLISQKKKQLDRVKRQCAEAEVKRDRSAKTKSQLLEELGKLRTEHKQHVAKIAKRDTRLNELSKELGLGEASLDEGEPLYPSQIQNIMRNWKQRLSTTQQELSDAKVKYETQESRIQAKIDEVRDLKSKKDQERKSSEQKISKNRSTIENIVTELSHANTLADRQDELERDLRETEEELAVLEKSIDVNALRTEISKKQSIRKELEAKLISLNREMNQLQKESKVRNEFDLVTKDKSAKQETFNKLHEKHKETVIHLLGSMPAQNVQDSIKSLITNLRQETRTINSNMGKKKDHLTTLRANKTHLTEELEKKQSQLQNHKDKIFDACGSQNFDEGFDVLKKTVKELQDGKSALTGSLYLINKYIEGLNAKPCCPLCTREFQQKKEADALVKKLQGQLSKVPSKLEEKNKLILEHQKKLDSMIELKPVKEEAIRIEGTEIPELDKKIAKITEDIEKIASEISDLEEILDDKQSDLHTATTISPDLAVLDQQQRELDRINRRLSTLKCQLGGSDVTRTVQQVSSEQTSIQTELDSVRQEIETIQQQISDHNEQVQHLRSRINDLRSEKNEIASSLQRKNSLEEQKCNLAAENIQLTSTIKEVKQEIISLEKKIQELTTERKSMVKEKEIQLEKIRNKISKQEKEMDAIKQLTTEIDRYVNEGKEAMLANHEEKIENITSELDKKSEEISKLNNEEKELNKEVTSQQLKYREFEDNMKLMNVKADIIELRKNCKSLKNQIGGYEIRTLLSQKKNLAEQEKKLTKERSEHEGRLTELEGQIKSLNNQLQDKMFKDADKKHREMLIQLRTTELACEDLNKYYIALDRAIMSYHRMKMDEINKIVRDLWIKTYAGNDIEYIEIRSNEDDSEAGLEKGRRVYNYKVVMVKGDTAIDMRGRCSAGQKVLASLIIRLALAETFCLNCGVLALDEPTTNLDRDNISSLAQALVNIVQSRSQQKNFQLVIITHDEDFIELLGRSETVDYFYKVSKDSNACSKVTKCQISEMA